MSNYYVVRTRYDVDEFVRKSRVAVGWSDVDFTRNIDNWEKLKEELCKRYYSYEGLNKSFIGRKTNEVKRFIEMKKGDIIVVPAYRTFYIGHVTGEFFYEEADRIRDLANQLGVEFKKDKDGNPMVFERKGKNTALMSKLRVRGFTVLDITDPVLNKCVDDLLASEADISDAQRVKNIEEKQLEGFKQELLGTLQNYKQTSLDAGGVGFEHLVKKLMESDGYEANILAKTVGGKSVADVDIVAYKDSSLGDFFATACYIQVKHHRGVSDGGVDQILDFKRKREENIDDFINLKDEYSFNKEDVKYVLISSGDFTQEARNKAE